MAKLESKIIESDLTPKCMLLKTGEKGPLSKGRLFGAPASAGALCSVQIHLDLVGFGEPNGVNNKARFRVSAQKIPDMVGGSGFSY